jgi:uncharacterized protein YdhG (YjbR/CyaY superfamily)
MPAASVTEYLTQLPDNTKQTVNKIRDIIKATAPDAAEMINYGVIGYKVPNVNRAFIFLGGYTKHVSIYPIPGDVNLRDQLKPFIAGKGTLRFELDQSIPFDLIKEISKALYQTAVDQTN